MAGTGKKIIAGSFWLVMAIHLVVFTAIGFATSSWRLLLIFLAGFLLLMAVYAGVKVYLARHPEKKDTLKLPLLRNAGDKSDKKNN